MTTIPPTLPPPPPPPDTAQVEAIIRAIVQNAEALAQLPAQRLVVRAQIIAAEAAQTPEAEIILRLSTPRGEVRVELPPETPPLPPEALRPGTPIELELPPRPPGEIPREVLLRILSDAAPLPPETPPVRGTQTPVQVRLEPLPAPIQTPLAETLIPPQPGAPVRLEPLPPALIPHIIKSLPAQNVVFTPAPDAFTPALSVAALPATKPEDIPDLPIRATFSKIPAPALTQTPAPLSLPSPLGGEGYIGLAPTGAYPASGEGQITVPSAPSSPASTTPSAPPITKTLPLSVAAQPAPPAAPEENPSIILKPQASPDVLVAKVEGFVRPESSPTNTLPTLTPVVSLPAFSFEGEAPLYLLHTPAAASLVPGSEITLSITPDKPAMPQASAPPSAMLTALPPYAFPALAPQSWPLMDEIAQTLTLAAPAAAQALSNMTPSPARPAQMPQAALFFIAAIRGGDLQSWLGDKAVDALKQAGKTSLVSRLSGEGDALSRLAADPLPGEWRGLPLPMAFQNEIHRAALYFRHEAEDENEGDGQGGGKGTRFIMDLNLSRLGPVQLDGYARPGKFDLILRTQEPFSTASRQAMRDIFTTTLDIEGLKGELGFQSKPESWVKIGPSEQNLYLSL